MNRTKAFATLVATGAAAATLAAPAAAAAAPQARQAPQAGAQAAGAGQAPDVEIQWSKWHKGSLQPGIRGAKTTWKYRTKKGKAGKYVDMRITIQDTANDKKEACFYTFGSPSNTVPRNCAPGGKGKKKTYTTRGYYKYLNFQECVDNYVVREKCSPVKRAYTR